jgi:hypothetical protein
MTYLWLVWLALFGVLEAYALWSPKAGDTLSEHVWEWFAIAPHGEADKRPVTPGIRLRRFALGAFLAWLSLHFLTGGAF